MPLDPSAYPPVADLLRRLPLAPSTLAALRELHDRADPDPADPVVCGRQKKHRLLSNFKTAFAAVLAAAGLSGVKPYDLRHTMATLMLQANVPLKVVSERLGHEDVTTTLRHYSHVLPGMQQRAADAMQELFSKLRAPQLGAEAV